MNRSITGFLGGLIFLGLFVGTAQATVVDSLRVELASSRTDTQRMRLHFALMSAQTYAAADTLVAACQAARSVAMRLGQSKDIGRTWYLEGWALNRKGSFAASIQASEQAGHFFAEAGELKQQTKAMVNLSNSYRQMGNPHKAKEMLEGMLEKVEKEKDTLLVATVRNNIAILHAQEGEFALAATYFASCLNDFQQVGDSLEVANAANNLGNVNLKLRNYTQAVDWYIRAARIDEELKNFRGLAGDYNNISHIYLEIGDPKQALTYSNSSFAAYQQIGNVRGMVMSLNTSAGIHRKMGDYEAGFRLDQEALVKCENNGIKDQRYGNTQFGLGKYWLHKEDEKRSLKYLESAAKSFELAGWESRLPAVYILLGKVYQRRNKVEKAIEYLELALQIGKTKGDRKISMESHRNLFELYQKKGQMRLALDNLVEAEALEDSIYSLENTEKIATIQAQYDVEKRKRELLEEKQRSDNLRFGKELAEARSKWILGLTSSIVLVLGGLFFGWRIRARTARMLLENKATMTRESLRLEQAERERLEVRLTEQAINMSEKAHLVNQMREEVERIQEKYSQLGPQEFMHLFKVVEHNIRSDKDWTIFKQNFEKIHPAFFPNLLNKYPDLKPAEIRLGVLIRLGMNQKDIANILNIHTDSVKRARNRLRHKLALETKQNLREYLCKF